MTTEQLKKIEEINNNLIDQNREFVRKNEWSLDTTESKAAYAAGYMNALEFINNQFKRVRNNWDLHDMTQQEMKKESGEYVLDAEYWDEPY